MHVDVDEIRHELVPDGLLAGDVALEMRRDAVDQRGVSDRRLELPLARLVADDVAPALAELAQRVCGNPRSTLDVAGSGQRDVTTLPRV